MEKGLPNTVQEMLEWKNLGDKGKIAKGWPVSVEENNKAYTEICGGKNRADVLYSFLGIYAIGVWVYNRKKPQQNDDLSDEIFIVDDNRIKMKNLPNGRKAQYLYSKKFLQEMQTKSLCGIENENIKKLNTFLEEKDGFLQVYFKVGNVISMWPGGNGAKGNQNKGFMDIPELFFKKYIDWFYILMGKYANEAFLDDINKAITTNSDERFNSLNSFLKWVADSKVKGDDIHYPHYEEYIKNIVATINDRTERINEYLSKNKVQD